LTGTTGKRVIVAGDSAGANMLAGLIINCGKYNLPRPDRFFCAYPSFLCGMYPSPSRLLALFDPIVLFPCLLRCINAYADADYIKSCPRSYVEGKAQYVNISLTFFDFRIDFHSLQCQSSAVSPVGFG